MFCVLLRRKHHIRFKFLSNLMNHKLTFHRIKIATEETAK